MFSDSYHGPGSHDWTLFFIHICSVTFAMAEGHSNRKQSLFDVFFDVLCVCVCLFVCLFFFLICIAQHIWACLARNITIEIKSFCTSQRSQWSLVWYWNNVDIGPLLPVLFCWFFFFYPWKIRYAFVVCKCCLAFRYNSWIDYTNQYMCVCVCVSVSIYVCK